MSLRNFLFTGFLLFIFFFLPLNTSAAEILQIRTSTLLQVGDRNRNYTVKLACIEVLPSDEEAAIALLRSQVRSKKRVNLKPKGAADGILLARVIPVDSTISFSEKLSKEGLGTLNC